MAVLLNLFSHLCNKFEDLVIITNKEYESGTSVIPFWEACSQEGQRHHLLPHPPVWIDALWTAFYSSEPWTERSGNSLITTAIMILNLEDRQKVVLISFHPHLFLCLHFNYENASFICGCNQVNVIYIFLCISLWYPVLYLLLQIKFPNGIIKFDLTYQAQTTSPSSNGLKA